MPPDSEGNGGGRAGPPRHTQFKKGQSGNPAGRPKKVTSFKSDLAAELQEKLSITENGKERKITKQRAFCKTLVAAAIKKDIRAVNALLACMRLFGIGQEQTAASPTDVDLSDLDLLETYLAQQRKQGEREQSAAGSASGRTARKRV
jgi:uncharacterized protein DUF5681